MVPECVKLGRTRVGVWSLRLHEKLNNLLTSARRVGCPLFAVDDARSAHAQGTDLPEQSGINKASDVCEKLVEFSVNTLLSTFYCQHFVVNILLSTLSLRLTTSFWKHV